MNRHWGAKARTRDRMRPWCISRGHAGTPRPQARRSASAGIFLRGRADRSEKPVPPLKTELHCCSVVCLTRPPARQLAYGRLFALGNRAGVVRKSFPPRIAGCSSRLCLSVSSLPSSLFFVFSHEQLRWLPNAMVPRSLFFLSVGTFFLVLLGMFFWVRGRGPG